MSTSVPLIVRLLASSVSVAGRAGKIVRDVMSKGELGIIEKVGIYFNMYVFEFFTNLMITKILFEVVLSYHKTGLIKIKMQHVIQKYNCASLSTQRAIYDGTNPQV